MHPSRVPVSRGKYLVQAAPSRLPTVLLSAAAVTFVAAMCYRGDPWARWLMIVLLVGGVIRASIAVIVERAPAAVAIGQLVVSATVIALLQAAAAREFLAGRRAARLRRRPPAGLGA